MILSVHRATHLPCSRVVEVRIVFTVGDPMSPTPPCIDAQANLMEAACTMVHNHCRRTGVVRDGQVAGIIREQHLFFELERVLPQRRPTTPARKRLSLAPVPFPGPFRVFNGSAPILSHTHPGILNFFLSTIRIAQVNGKH
jgi:hypothetical protein